MLQTVRERLTLVLLAVLPFHALLVTGTTQFLVGPGHAPLPALAIWKEVLLSVILVIAFLEWIKKPYVIFDLIDRVIIGLLALSVAATLFGHRDIGLYLLGFKYDFVPLIAFMALRRGSWSKAFVDQLFQALLIEIGRASCGG